VRSRDDVQAMNLTTGCSGATTIPGSYPVGAVRSARSSLWTERTALAAPIDQRRISLFMRTEREGDMWTMSCTIDVEADAGESVCRLCQLHGGLCASDSGVRRV